MNQIKLPPMKRILTLAVALCSLNVGLVVTASASTEGDKSAKRAEKVKTGIQKLGTGRDSRVEVQLTDGTKVRGFVSEIKDGSFVVVSDTMNVATEIPYPDAKKVQGNNLSSGAKIAIAVGIIAAIIIFAVAHAGD